MNNEQESANQTKPKGPPKKRMRSPYLFPAYDFSMARQIAERVEKDGAGSLSEETLAIALHLSIKSSGFQLKTLTARQFGLLTKQRETLSTTPMAKAIFKPTTESEKAKALIDSFLAIPLFREVATRFKGQPLPQGQAFRNILEREFRVDSRRVSDAERVLMDSARETGVLVTSGSNLYLSTEKTAPAQPSGVPQSGVGQLTPTALPSSPVPPAPSTGILTVSEDDLAEFDDSEFGEIWQTLGKIIRARGKRQRAQGESIIEEQGEKEENKE